MHIMVYYSVIKEWNVAICSNLDGIGGYYAKLIKSDRERQILFITYMWKLKNTNTNESMYKKETLTERKQTYG